MDDQRVDHPEEIRIPCGIDPARHKRDHHHAAPEHHPVPAGVQCAAEAGRQDAPEQAHRNIVQQGDSRAHTITRLFRKA